MYGMFFMCILLPIRTFVFGLRTKNLTTVECGPMLNVIAALSNIGGALCSTPQSLADAHYSSAVQ